MAQNIDEISPIASCYEQLRTILSMPVEGANIKETPILSQPDPVPDVQELEQPTQSSDTAKELDKVVTDQTLSLDTLSELNSLGGQ